MFNLRAMPPREMK